MQLNREPTGRQRTDAAVPAVPVAAVGCHGERAPGLQPQAERPWSESGSWCLNVSGSRCLNTSLQPQSKRLDFAHDAPVAQLDGEPLAAVGDLRLLAHIIRGSVSQLSACWLLHSWTPRINLLRNVNVNVR